ncbi:MAG: gamma carbonic anhydrase family protein [Gammaproteobacteria bacterium]|nr:gamma carbonic anhydrase family protein [Gammaproteobacteria bacterium]MBU1653436.1 gamma carbonic anhydrase family protein [Gammaproteobacteria bacterium]MBU1959741.1 gamma carbonic anhydrase family protein [Gammaproteobacteria bacterium]
MTPRIATDAWIDPTALVIGDVEIGSEASLWPHVVVRGDIHRIRIGARSNIQDGTVLHVTHDSTFVPGGHPLEIGDAVIVGHRVVLHGCRIENHCLIGMGAIVMDGAVLESEVILGAGSLVPPGKRLTGGHLWVGSPARQVRPLTEKERAHLYYSAENYARLGRKYAGD